MNVGFSGPVTGHYNASKQQSAQKAGFGCKIADGRVVLCENVQKIADALPGKNSPQKEFHVFEMFKGSMFNPVQHKKDTADYLAMMQEPTRKIIRPQ